MGTIDLDLPSITELLNRYEKGIVLFTDAVHGVPADRFDTPPQPGKWTARQIVAHVADCEAVAAVRYRMIAAQPGSTLTAFDQDRWANQLLYAYQPWEDALAAYAAMRRHNLHMLRALPPEAWSRSAIHEERGENTLFRMVKHNAEHVENHAGQVLNLRRHFARATGG
jgi:hypothetical protein